MSAKTVTVIKRIICAALVFTFALCLCACGEKSDIKKLGKGENNFYIIFEKNPGDIVRYEIWTDEVNVGDALLEHNLIKFAKTKKNETYVSTAEGITVDFDKTNEFWTIYSNGKYLSSNPCEIVIMSGDIYVMRIDKLVIPKQPDSTESDSSGTKSESSGSEQNTSSDGDGASSSDASSSSASSDTESAQSSSSSTAG